MGRPKTFSTTLGWVKAGEEDTAAIVELEWSGCRDLMDGSFELICKYE